MTSPDRGSSDLTMRTVQDRASNSFSQRKGNVIILKCRTPQEAYLVSDELEKADIIPILPGEKELLRQFKRNGCVELQVSANAYESVADLRSVVEFQYRKALWVESLSYFGKAL